MAKVRVEWITLGIGPHYDGRHENVIDAVIGSQPVIDVTATATAAGARPSAPAGERVHARITATSGKVIAAWGADPTASQSTGLLVMDGASEVVPVTDGDLLSFVQLVEA